MPEAVFKYFSKFSAYFLVKNAAYQITFHGLNFRVCLFAPSLCDLNLSFKSDVEPV